MPTYEYRCKECLHEFEAFQPMSAEPLKACPECEGELKRLIGPGAGIIFKGSGFYETDYRSDSYRKDAKSDKSSSSETSPSSSSSSDSKTKKTDSSSSKKESSKAS